MNQSNSFFIKEGKKLTQILLYNPNNRTSYLENHLHRLIPMLGGPYQNCQRTIMFDTLPKLKKIKLLTRNVKFWYNVAMGWRIGWLKIYVITHVQNTVILDTVFCAYLKAHVYFSCYFNVFLHLGVDNHLHTAALSHHSGWNEGKITKDLNSIHSFSWLIDFSLEK